MSTDGSPPILLVASGSHRPIAERVSAFLAPHYTYSHIATNLDEGKAIVAAIAGLDPSQRPRAWVVGGAIPREEVAPLAKELGIPMLCVVPGTFEKIGGDKLPAYVLGLLDGHFRQ